MGSLINSINLATSRISNIKSSLASKLTEKGMTTSSSESFDTMIAKVGAIETSPLADNEKTFAKSMSTLAKGDLVSVMGKCGMKTYMYPYITDNAPSGSVTASYTSFDRKVIAVTTTTSPFIYAYELSNDNKWLTPITIPSLSATPTCVALSSNGNYMVVCVGGLFKMYKRNAYVYQEMTLSTSVPNAYNCAFSPDDKTLIITASASPNVHMYVKSGDTLTSKQFTLSGTTASRKISFSPDSKYLVLYGNSGSSYTTVYKRSDDASTFTSIWTDYSKVFTKIAFDNNGYMYAINANYIRSYTVSDSGATIKTADTSYSSFGTITDFCITSDSKYVITRNSDNTTTIFKSTNGALTYSYRSLSINTLQYFTIKSINMLNDILLVFHENNPKIYAYYYDKVDEVFPMKSNVDAYACGHITSIDATPDGQLIFCGSNFKEGAFAYRSDSNKLKKTSIEYYTSPVEGVVYTPTNGILVAARISTDGTVGHTCYNYCNNGSFKKIPGSDSLGGGCCASITSTGITLAVGSKAEPSTITNFLTTYTYIDGVYTLPTARNVNSANVTSIAYSPDNTILACAGSPKSGIALSLLSSGNNYSALTLPSGAPTYEGVVKYSKPTSNIHLYHVGNDKCVIMKKDATTHAHTILTTLSCPGANNIEYVNTDTGYIVITSNTAPYIYIYKRSTDTYTLISTAKMPFNTPTYAAKYIENTDELIVSVGTHVVIFDFQALISNDYDTMDAIKAYNPAEFTMNLGVVGENLGFGDTTIVSLL